MSAWCNRSVDFQICRVADPVGGVWDGSVVRQIWKSALQSTCKSALRRLRRNVFEEGELQPEVNCCKTCNSSNSRSANRQPRDRVPQPRRHHFRWLSHRSVSGSFARNDHINQQPDAQREKEKRRLQRFK